MTTVDSSLIALTGRGIRPSLDVFRQALAELGLGDPAYRRILIAGTNGKGSTTAMVANALRLAGMKVGMLISPHLIDVRERVQLNGQWISEEKFSSIFQTIFPLIEKYHLTYYEAIVLLGFYYFREEKIDIAVLEVGMGGRFDATNAIDPHIAAITTVSWDHQAYLGNTLAAIAGEKAGIARPGRPLICGVTASEAKNAIKNSCEKLGALYQEVKEIDVELTPHSLPGRHQSHNARVAYAILKAAQKRLPALTDASIVEGIRSARNPGRLQQVMASPPVYLDGAHNREGMAMLRTFIAEHYPNHRIVLVFSMMRDKDYHTIAQDLGAWVHQLYFVELPEPRALDFESFHQAAPDIPCERLDLARVKPDFFADASEDNAFFICGSLYLVGAVLKQWNE